MELLLLFLLKALLHQWELLFNCLKLLYLEILMNHHFLLKTEILNYALVNRVRILRVFNEFSAYDSLGWLIYQTGLINTTFTSKDLPPNSPLQLNTSNIIMKQIVPKLDSIFPDDGMQLQVACAASVPNTTAPMYALKTTLLTQ